MRLDNELEPGEIGRRPLRRTLQQFGERHYAGPDLGDPRVLRQQFGRITAPDRQAGRFQADHWRSRRNDRMQDVKCCAQLPSRAVELARADPGQSAAGWSLQELRRVAGRRQQRDGCCYSVSGEAVGEGVHPKDHRRSARCRRRHAFARRGRSELGEGATLIDAGRPADQTPQPRSRCRDVDQSRQSPGPGDQPAPARQPAEGVVAAWSDLPAIGVIKDLRLVRGHVDPGRAVTRASLA